MPSGVAGKHEVPLVKSGRCSIQMTFSEPIPQGCQFNSYLYILIWGDKLFYI